MDTETTYRPSIGTEILLGGVWAVFFLVSVYGYFFQSLSPAYVLIAGIILAVFIIWCRTVSITVSPDEIISRSGFGREARLFWQDIGEIRTRVHVAGSKAKYETILVSNTPSKKDIRINIKLFGKKDLVEFASILPGKAVSATIDDATKGMAHGTIPDLFEPRRPGS